VDPSDLHTIVSTFGGTSPVIGLVAWHMWNMQKSMSKLADNDDKVSEALGRVRERLVAVETHLAIPPSKD
jgi:phage-related minor tail protein